MKIYMDVCCLNRPFDDQSQLRIRLESEAITLIIERVDRGEWSEVSSEIAVLEIRAISDAERRERVKALLPEKRNIHKLTETTFPRASALMKFGFKPADALHVAAAEQACADIFLSCDDQLCKLGKRHRNQLNVRVVNPLEWIKEIEDASNA